jgi:hypothetical protein
MTLVKDWQDLEAQLPARWVEARIGLALEEDRQAERALELLAPLQPMRTAPGSVSIRIARTAAAEGPSAESLRRALQRLDAERLHGRLEIIAADEGPASPEAGGSHLPESWDAAVAALPADWSDVLGEIELDSDYVEPARLNLAPMNPRRVGKHALSLQFRSARFRLRRASPECAAALERCDAVGITGRVEVLRVLSDTRPVGTQGPVWQIEGRMV